MRRKTTTRKGVPDEAPTEMFRPNPWNPNNVTPDVMEKLTRGITKTYTEQKTVPPIIVRDLPEGDTHTWEIIDGEHRWKVFVAQGFPNIPFISLGQMSASKAKILTSSLNWLRGDPDPKKYTQMVESILVDEEDPLSLDVLGSLLPESEGVLEDMLSLMGDGLANIDLSHLSDEDDEGEGSGSSRVRREIEEDFEVEAAFLVKSSSHAKLESVRMQLEGMVQDFTDDRPAKDGSLIDPERVDDLLFIVLSKLFKAHVTSMDDVFATIKLEV